MSDKLTDKDRQLLAREIAADRYDIPADDFKQRCSECSDEVFFFEGPSKYRVSFVAGWNTAIEYINSTERLSPQYQTMRALLDYPNPVGLHDNEARWRDFARALLEL